jgi:hypothetical protein
LTFIRSVKDVCFRQMSRLALVPVLFLAFPVLAQDAGPASLAEAYEQVLAERTSQQSSEAGTQSETLAAAVQSLAEYARECDKATGIKVPAFNCGDGVSVPGQGNVPRGTLCDQPNVLNGVCDPGSKFQVLPGSTADAVAVAHCRRDGQPVDGPLFNDIAVIQYNKKNGAICFYQALKRVNDPPENALPANVPAPLAIGEGVWQPGSGAHWIDPVATEKIGCTGCHNNGGFIRSPYLAQLRTPPHALPNRDTGYTNLDTPLRYVGSAYAKNKSWSITVPELDENGGSCTNCHRLAVSNRLAFSIINGTAAHFSALATAKSQKSKSPHSAASPIWMRPNQKCYKKASEDSALRYKKCAEDFFNSGFLTIGPGCEKQELGMPWVGDETAQLAVALKNHLQEIEPESEALEAAPVDCP